MPDPKRKIVSVEQVRNALNYSPETGEFHRRVGRYAGQLAGAYNSDGYRRIQVDGRTYYAHRLAWLHVYGYLPHEIDHINGDRSDNRICNLREASRVLNIANKKVRTVYGHKGVARSKRKGEPAWAAYIRVDGKSKRLGTFNTIEEAATAYRKAAVALYGEFARVI